MQFPEDQQEQYSKGQHLRGADALNAEQVRAELVSLRQYFALLHAACRLAKFVFMSYLACLLLCTCTQAEKDVHSLYWLT